jgi:hypothetical protein
MAHKNLKQVYVEKEVHKELKLLATKKESTIQYELNEILKKELGLNDI